MNEMALAATLAAASLIAAPVTPALAKKPSPVTAFDTDNDATVDSNWARKSAEGLFEKLDADKDGSVESKELHGRLSKKEFKVADPDNDGTIDKNEFIALLEALFKAADPDGDGTLDEKELGSTGGKSLLRVVR